MTRFHSNGSLCEASKRACPLGVSDHFESAEDLSRGLVERDIEADLDAFYAEHSRLTDETMQEMSDYYESRGESVEFDASSPSFADDSVSPPF